MYSEQEASVSRWDFPGIYYALVPVFELVASTDDVVLLGVKLSPYCHLLEPLGQREGDLCYSQFY